MPRFNPLLEQLATYPAVAVDKRKAELVASGQTVYDFGKGDPEEPPPAALEELFKDAHGGPFDPKSSMDRRKMGEIKQLLAEQGGQGDMTNNQFALKLYRRFDYV